MLCSAWSPPAPSLHAHRSLPGEGSRAPWLPARAWVVTLRIWSGCRAGVAPGDFWLAGRAGWWVRRTHLAGRGGGRLLKRWVRVGWALGRVAGARPQLVCWMSIGSMTIVLCRGLGDNQPVSRSAGSSTDQSTPSRERVSGPTSKVNRQDSCPPSHHRRQRRSLSSVRRAVRGHERAVDRGRHGFWRLSGSTFRTRGSG